MFGPESFGNPVEPFGFAHRGRRRRGPHPHDHGGPWGGRRGRGRGGRAAKGDLRGVIMYLLSQEPMHGYQLITEIGERTEGRWTPSPGAIYPTLSLLEDEGLITLNTSSGRKIASLTEAGQALVAERREALAGIIEAYRTAAEEAEGAAEAWQELHGEMGRLRFAVRDALRSGDRARQVTEIISRARREIEEL